MTWPWVVNPFAVSEIEWVRPSWRSALMLTSPRSSSAASVRLTGPLSKPMT
jgi:hypothetical protein